jgi:hypothetical protein
VPPPWWINHLAHVTLHQSETQRVTKCTMNDLVQEVDGGGAQAIIELGGIEPLELLGRELGEHRFPQQRHDMQPHLLRILAGRSWPNRRLYRLDPLRDILGHSLPVTNNRQPPFLISQRPF